MNLQMAIEDTPASHKQLSIIVNIIIFFYIFLKWLFV